MTALFITAVMTVGIYIARAQQPQQPPPANMKGMDMRGMNQRGDKVMGFDHDKTTRLSLLRTPHMAGEDAS